MDLRDGGMDIFYIDESVKHPFYVASAVCIPFIRNTESGWSFVWGDYLNDATDWRRYLSNNHRIKSRKELHAHELIASKGLYKIGGHNLNPNEAVGLYRDAIGSLDFIPNSSIITCFANDKTSLMGATGIKASLFGLFQRIRSQCGRNRNGMIFFDDGHLEYINWYRQASKYLPTGSRYGGWDGQQTKNLPLEMFPKDANIKPSSLSIFLQIADLIAYAARVKLEAENNLLAAKRIKRGHDRIYDSLNISKINLRVRP